MYNYTFFLIPTTHDFPPVSPGGSCYAMDLCLCHGSVTDLFTIKLLRV